MLKMANVEVMNFKGALRGMRNPLESWEKSDSVHYTDGTTMIGDHDYRLAMRLATAGSDHGKFLRQILVSVDIEAPLYWWKEFDAYKVGTTANSTSTMHKLGTRELTPADFSWDVDGTQYISSYRRNWLNDINKDIRSIQDMKAKAKESGDDKLQDYINSTWRRIVQDLPSSFNQTRTVTMNYENLRNMYFARKNHKLEEWHTFCKQVKGLPYSELITTPRK